MTKHQQNIADWMKPAGQIIRIKPDMMTPDERKLRARLILEEAIETIRDGLGLALKEAGTDHYLSWEGVLFEFTPIHNGNLIELADGIADLSYVAYGTAVAAGIDMEPVDAEVHRSNMSKFIDGHRDAGGKWIKGPSYSPANIKAILEAQA